MNKQMTYYIIGRVLKILALMLLLPILVAIIYREDTVFSFALPLLLSFTLGSILSHKKPEYTKFYIRDGFITVGLVWIVLGIIGCFPFLISGEIKEPINALYETISGFTTTGSTLIKDVESLSKSILFWRSFTQWFGGMGILVFMLAFMPQDEGGSTMHIMKGETPGPMVGKLVPHIRKTALILYAIYFMMTIAHVVALLFAGLPLFDALCISFGSAGTGGLSIYNDSMASMTPLALNITASFMMLFGVNFTIYYLLLIKRFKEALKNEEFRFYGLIISIAFLFVGLNSLHLFTNVSLALTHSFFQITSIITTTGYTSVEISSWTSLSKTIFLLLMFVGSCAGSTGGGFKISRVLILIKGVMNEVVHFTHPRQVKMVKINDKVIDSQLLQAVNMYFAIYTGFFVLSLLIISLENFDIVSNISAVLSSLSNIGTDLITAGNTHPLTEYSILSKCILMIDMLAGRLEFVPILLLFHPKSWRK